jgi:hypothetical protein
MVDREAALLTGYTVNDQSDASGEDKPEGPLLTTKDLLKRAKTQLGTLPSTEYKQGKRLG